MTAPRPGRIKVDAVHGVGCSSKEVITVEVALTSLEAAGKESTARGQVLQRRRPQPRYWVGTAAACCCYFGGGKALPTNGHTSK